MIFNLVAENTREGEVMHWLLRKLDDMRRALGSDRVYDVIGEIVPAPKFDALMKDWLSRRKTMAEILAEIDLQTDEEQVARIRADMEDKSLGSRYIDMSKLLADQQQSKEHRLMPEYIEKFFVEAYRSFGGTITPGQGQEGHLVHQPRSARPAEAARPDRAPVRQDRQRPTRRSPSTRNRSSATPTWNSSARAIRCSRAWWSGCLTSTARSLRQGACFFNADATEPTVLWLLKCGVEDGRGQAVGERLFAVHLTAERFRKSQPYALLDLKPPEGEPEVPGEFVRRPPTRIASSTGRWTRSRPNTSARSHDRRTRELAHQGEVRPQVAPVPHQRVGQEDRQVRQPVAADAGSRTTRRG